MDAPAIFAGQRVTFTGRLASMSHAQAIRLVRSRGGVVTARVSRHTQYVVIGTDGWPLRTSGKLTRNLQRAARLQQSGHPIEILPESTFLRRLRLVDEDDPVCGLYSLEQLSRMCGVSGRRLRHWVDAGWIEPVQSHHGVALFDFTQVAATRTLWRLMSAGCRPQVLRESIQRLQRWMPDASRTLQSLERMYGALVVRTAEGTLVDPHGQQLFDFDHDADHNAAISWTAATWLGTDADAAFEDCLRWHDCGECERAIEAYELWLNRFGSDSDVLFNLGNLLLAAGNAAAAVERFREALSAGAEEDCRVWNNLGLALAEAGHRDEAIEALRKAVQCDADFADAYYNLADLLEEAGYTHQARLLWQRYLRYDTTSEHAQYAAQRVAPCPGK